MTSFMSFVQVLGNSKSLAYEPWPAFDEGLLVLDTFNLPIQVWHVTVGWCSPPSIFFMQLWRAGGCCLGAQVNGKLRGTVEVPKDIAREHAEALALSLPSVSKHMDGMSVKKVVFVPGRIMNFIVGKD